MKFLKFYTITLNESEYQTVIRGIHMQYLKYGGDIEDDEVYNYNSELDELLHNIKKQNEEE